MKTVIRKSVLQATTIGLILAGGLMFGPLASAAEKTGPQAQIPATSDAIWQSIDREAEQLNKVIQTGKLEEVHHHAFAIRDLAATLPAHSPSLPADKLNQVKANNKFVATLAERLDATGDAKDKAGTESNFQKLKGVLKTMRANYLGT